MPYILNALYDTHRPRSTRSKASTTRACISIYSDTLHTLQYLTFYKTHTGKEAHDLFEGVDELAQKIQLVGSEKFEEEKKLEAAKADEAEALQAQKEKKKEKTNATPEMCTEPPKEDGGTCGGEKVWFNTRACAHTHAKMYTHPQTRVHTRARISAYVHART